MNEILFGGLLGTVESLEENIGNCLAKKEKDWIRKVDILKKEFIYNTEKILLDNEKKVKAITDLEEKYKKVCNSKSEIIDQLKDDLNFARDLLVTKTETAETNNKEPGYIEKIGTLEINIYSLKEEIKVTNKAIIARNQEHNQLVMNASTEKAEFKEKVQSLQAKNLLLNTDNTRLVEAIKKIKDNLETEFMAIEKKYMHHKKAYEKSSSNMTYKLKKSSDNVSQLEMTEKKDKNAINTLEAMLDIKDKEKAKLEEKHNELEDNLKKKISSLEKYNLVLKENNTLLDGTWTKEKERCIAELQATQSELVTANNFVTRIKLEKITLENMVKTQDTILEEFKNNLSEKDRSLDVKEKEKAKLEENHTELQEQLKNQICTLENNNLIIKKNNNMLAGALTKEKEKNKAELQATQTELITANNLITDIKLEIVNLEDKVTAKDTNFEKSKIKYCELVADCSAAVSRNEELKNIANEKDIQINSLLKEIDRKSHEVGEYKNNKIAFQKTMTKIAGNNDIEATHETFLDLIEKKLGDYKSQLHKMEDDKSEALSKYNVLKKLVTDKEKQVGDILQAVQDFIGRDTTVVTRQNFVQLLKDKEQITQKTGDKREALITRLKARHKQENQQDLYRKLAEKTGESYDSGLSISTLLSLAQAKQR